MFYSKELLHLVFADENDTYYDNGLLELDLNRLLWFELHRRQFSSVYFLEINRDDCRVLHYGDRTAQEFDPEKGKKKLFAGQKSKVKAERLGAWLEERLRGKNGERAAVVCPLRSFCAYFDSELWDPILNRLADMEQRSGILVLTAPPEAEETKDFFLNSLVFDALRENGVTALRDAKSCKFFHALSRALGERCTYLNLFTEERLRQVLRHLLLADPKKCEDYTDAALPAAYLFQYLNNKAFRSVEETQGLRLQIPSGSFRRLHDSFLRGRDWKTMVRRLKAMEEAGGIAAFCEENDLPFITDLPDRVGVRHRADSYAARCLALELPAEEADPSYENAVQRLAEIKDEVADPRNRNENPEIVDAILRFEKNINSARDAGDRQTQYRSLDAISFCLQWLYVESESCGEENALRLIDMLETSLSLSERYFSLQQIKSSAAGKLSAGKTEKLAAEQVAAEALGTGKMLDRMERLLRASMMKAALPTVDSLRQVEDDLRAFEETGVFRPEEREFEFEDAEAFDFDPAAAQNGADGFDEFSDAGDASAEEASDEAPDLSNFEFVLRDGIDDKYR